MPTYLPPDSHPLRDVPVGTAFTISRIPEELEFEPGMLDFLEEHSLQPGHSGVLTVISPDGTATVEVDGAHVGVPAYAHAADPRHRLSPTHPGCRGAPPVCTSVSRLVDRVSAT